MQLGSLEITRDSLLSNITREFIGERTFTEFAGITNQGTADGLGTRIAKFIGNGLLKFGGFLLKSAFSFIEWSFSGLWEMILETSYELAYFDWNQSDKEINEFIKESNLAMIRQFGQFAGSGTVWLTSIAVSSALTVKFPVLAGKVALALANEGGQSLRGQLVGNLQFATLSAIKSVALGSYLWVRKLIKGEETKENNKPWIIAEKVEKTLKKIPNETTRNFAEGFLDGALDSILDIGYIVAFTLDDYYAAAREAVNETEQPVRRLEVFPDADSNESIILEDTQEAVEEQLNNYLSNHDLINNRDVGTVVGQPYDEWYGQIPQSRKMVLEFNANEKPPFLNEAGEKTKRVQISIPNVKAGISWQDLKLIKKFTWGNYMARGVFEDRRQMTVWGSSEGEAKNTLLELAKLSTKSIIQVSVSHPEIQNMRRRKRPTVVHPVFATMLVRKRTPTTGDTTLIDGQNRAMAKERVEIWREEKPDSFTGFT